MKSRVNKSIIDTMLTTLVKRLVTVNIIDNDYDDSLVKRGVHVDIIDTILTPLVKRRVNFDTTDTLLTSLVK